MYHLLTLKVKLLQGLILIFQEDLQENQSVFLGLLLIYENSLNPDVKWKGVKLSNIGQFSYFLEKAVFSCNGEILQPRYVRLEIR